MNILFFFRDLSLLYLCAVIGSSLAAYFTITDDLYDELSSCSTDIANDIECISSVKEGLETMSDFIQDVSTLACLLFFSYCDWRKPFNLGI